MLVDKDMQICDGSVTSKLVEEIICDYLKTNAKLVSCRGEIISRGLGFTSDVMRLSLQWSDVGDFGLRVNKCRNLVLPKTVIAKTPKSQCLEEILKNFSVGQNKPDDTNSMPVDQMMKLIHDAECNAYKVLLMEPGTPPVPLPLIYCCRMANPPVIIMEDMSVKAANVQDIALGLSQRQWENIADCLADLHAWSLTTTSVPWRQYVGGVETLARMFEDWISRFSGALKFTKEKYAEFADVDEKLYEKEVEFNRLMSNYAKYRLVLPDVMQHGDTWTNNIFFEKDEVGQPGDEVAALIDWQISFAGCGLSDLARVSFMCVNHQMRRRMAPQIVNRYFTRLRSKAGRMINNHVAFDQVWKVYQHIFAINGLMGVLMTDFFLRFIAKIENPEDSRYVEIINRMKAGYDDAALFLSQADYDKF